MKDVLLHATIRAGSDLENGVQHALGLAASHGARVTALLTEVEPRSASLAPPDNMQGGIPPPVGIPPGRGGRAHRVSHPRDSGGARRSV